MGRHPSELRADFQEYYGLNIDGMGRDYTALHAAALLDQLPPNARVRAAANPAARWGEAEYLMARIDYRLQTVAWVAAGCPKRGMPVMMRTPADDARLERMRRASDPDAIADKLNIPIDRR